MTRARLVVGLAVAFLVGAVVVVAARRLRRRLVPGWTGLEGLLADIVLTVSVVTVVANLVGAIGWFAPWPFATALIVVSVPLWLLGVGPVDAGTVDPPRADPTGVVASREPGWSAWAVAAAIGAIGVAWVRSLPVVYRHGIYEWDSVWYHLPAAADFVQAGSFLPMRYYGADIATATYPFGAEVFHAIGMLATGSDILSPLVNLGWAALLLLGAHVFGRRFGTPHLGTLAALGVLVLPVMVVFEASTAMSEMMGLAAMVAAMAFVAGPAAAVGRGRLVLVGLSIGLLASTKLTMLGPAVALLVAVLVIEGLRGRARLRRGILPLAVAACATGGFWYLRNIVRFGSPVPAFELALGPLRLGHVEVAGTNAPMLPTMLASFGSGEVTAILSGALGPVWMVYLAVPVVAVIGAARRRKSTLVVLGAFSVVSLMMGLLTPQYTRDGIYQNLWSNTRYLLPGILPGLLVATAVVGRSARAARLAVVGLAGVVVLTFLSVVKQPWNAAAATASVDSWVVPSVLVALVAAVGVMTSQRQRSSPRARRRVPPTMVTAGMVMVVLVGVVLIEPTYDAGRYRSFRSTDAKHPSEADTFYAWAQRHEGLRIAVQPYTFADFVAHGYRELKRGEPRLLLTYGLYGDDLSNRVHPVASFDGTRVVPAATCTAWWDALVDFDATHVLVWEGEDDRERPAYRAWTEASSSAEVVEEVAFGVPPSAHMLLYRVDPLDAPTCRPVADP